MTTRIPRVVFQGCWTALALLAGCAGGRGDVQDDPEAAREAAARDAAAPHVVQAEAAGANKRESLRHYIAALAAMPAGEMSNHETDVRERCIRLVLSLDPPPAVPEAAQHRFNRGEALAKGAKNEFDYAKAADEFEAGLRIAPWEARAYYNLGLLREIQKAWRAGALAFRLYAEAAPDAPDRAVVQKKRAELEVKAERTGPRALAGIWREYGRGKVPFSGKFGGTFGRHYRFEVRGSYIEYRELWDVDNPNTSPRGVKGEEWTNGRFKWDGRKIRYINKSHGEECSWSATFNGVVEGIINEDFTMIELEIRHSPDGKHHHDWTTMQGKGYGMTASKFLYRE